MIDFETDEFSARELFILIPSKITFVKGKIKEDIVYQNVTFERKSTPVIAYLDENIYIDIFENIISWKKEPLIKQKAMPKCYFDQKKLCEQGVIKNNLIGNEKNEFVNVFDGDVTLLSDYIFAHTPEYQEIFFRFKYFKHPFRKNNMDLKVNLSEELLENKLKYTREELKELRNKLLEIKLPYKSKQKRYKVIHIPRQKVFSYGSFFETGPLYSGISGYSDSFSAIELLKKEVKKVRR